MNEPLVTIQQAKDLKDMDFKECVVNHFFDSIAYSEHKPYDYNSTDCVEGHLSRPANSQTLRWFREVHGLHGYVKPIFCANTGKMWHQFVIGIQRTMQYGYGEEVKAHDTAESALITQLIQLVKEQGLIKQMTLNDKPYMLVGVNGGIIEKWILNNMLHIGRPTVSRYLYDCNGDPRTDRERFELPPDQTYSNPRIVGAMSEDECRNVLGDRTHTSKGYCYYNYKTGKYLPSLTAANALKWRCQYELPGYAEYVLIDVG